MKKYLVIFIALFTLSGCVDEASPWTEKEMLQELKAEKYIMLSDSTEVKKAEFVVVNPNDESPTIIIKTEDNMYLKTRLVSNSDNLVADSDYLTIWIMIFIVIIIILIAIIITKN